MTKPKSVLKPHQEQNAAYPALATGRTISPQVQSFLASQTNNFQIINVSMSTRISRNLHLVRRVRTTPFALFLSEAIPPPSHPIPRAGVQPFLPQLLFRHGQYVTVPPLETAILPAASTGKFRYAKKNGSVYCHFSSCENGTPSRNYNLGDESYTTKNNPFYGESVSQLFQEIASRSEFAERKSPRAANERVKISNDTGDKTRPSRKSAANLSSEFCQRYLSLPEKSLSSWKKNTPSVASDEEDQVEHFLHLLVGSDYGIDDNVLLTAIENLQSHSSGDSPGSVPVSSIRRLREICTPIYEKIFFYILGTAQNDLGVAFLVKLRRDCREMIHYCKFLQQGGKRESGSDRDQEQQIPILHQHLPKLQNLEKDVHSILTSLFRPGVLQLKQITYHNTPASIIEQIAFKEAVHPLQSLQDLRTRLGPGRRCFAFFHPALPNKPLVFVHVALMQDIPETMNDIAVETQSILDGTSYEFDATSAIFYSITNTEPGLAGVDLGNHLIKQVVKVLKEEFPNNLQTFCTLSPIPNFRKWLEGKLVRYQEDLLLAEQQSTYDNTSNSVSNMRDFKFVDGDLFTGEEIQQLKDLFPSSSEPLMALLDTLKDPHWHTTSTELSQKLKPLLLKLAAYYLAVESRHGRPLCPVAKFHIRNGAEMYRLNYMADTSSKGMRNSCGMMINYRYLLDEIEQNHVNYETSGAIKVRDGVNSWL